MFARLLLDSVVVVVVVVVRQQLDWGDNGDKGLYDEETFFCLFSSLWGDEFDAIWKIVDKCDDDHFLGFLLL